MLRLEKAHIKPVSLMLARAFKDDPINAYAFPNPAERMEKMPYAYQFILRYNLLYGGSFTTSPQLEGAAVWLHSDNLVMSFWKMLISGAIWPAMKIGMEACRKMRVFDQYMERKHSELVPTKHWYLLLLGVDPQHQGKGYAGKLLNEMFTVIDVEGLPCYLETESSQNVSMYQHFGFNVIDEFIVPDTMVKIWAMLRKPKVV
ncbi:MAG: GNAT family N-acetyltransferase [Dehalococcoidales bacterium]|nr:GNAT family N-acetyltransferase [Dehalococcoidales bacterium]